MGKGLINEASPSQSDTPLSVGLLWKSYQPGAYTSTGQHSTRDRHPCPRRDSKPPSQQRSHTHALDRAAKGIGLFRQTSFKLLCLRFIATRDIRQLCDWLTDMHVSPASNQSNLLQCKKVGKVHPCTGTEALYIVGGGGEAKLYSSLTTALEGGEGSASRPGRSLPLEKTRYPLYRRLGGPQGRSGQVRKISLPSGFDPRTIQPVASRYTDYATRPTSYSAQQIKCWRERECSLFLMFICTAPSLLLYSLL